MSKGQQVGGPTAAIAHNDGHWRRVGDTLQDGANGVRAALQDEAHHGGAVVLGSTPCNKHNMLYCSSIPNFLSRPMKKKEKNESSLLKDRQQ